jgi:hypothetical protein
MRRQLFLAEAAYNAPHLAHSTGRIVHAIIKEQADIARSSEAQPGWFRVDLDDNDVPTTSAIFTASSSLAAWARPCRLRNHRMLGNAETPRLFGIRYAWRVSFSRPTGRSVPLTQ